AVYNELLKAQPDLPAAHVVYANFLSRQQRGLDAIAHLDRTISDGLEDAALWEQLLRLEISERRIQDAQATLKEMEDRHADDPARLRSKARLALADGKYADALTALEPLTGARESAEAERLRAVAHLELKSYGAATAAIQRAIALAPNDLAPSLRIKASIHDAAGEWQDSRLTLAALATKAPLSPAEELMRVRAIYGRGDAKAGREALVALLKDDHAPPGAAVEYAKREGAGDPKGAREYLHKALAKAPGNYDALEAATLQDIHAGEVQPALARLDKLVQSQLASPKV